MNPQSDKTETAELTAKARSPGSWNADRHPADTICGHLENAQAAFPAFSLQQPRYSAFKPRPALPGSTARSLRGLDFPPSGSRQYLCPAD